MSEQSIFLAALNFTDSVERFEFVIKACAGNTALLRKVETLLAAHEKSGQFLEMPALKQMSDAPELTRAEDSSERDEVDLPYLNPSTKPGSFGTLGHYDILQVLGQGGFGTMLRPSTRNFTAWLQSKCSAENWGPRRRLANDFCEKPDQWLLLNTRMLLRFIASKTSLCLTSSWNSLMDRRYKTKWTRPVQFASLKS